MKLLSLGFGVLVCLNISACGADKTRLETKETPSIYDAQLAQKLGADEYGMRSYVLVILKTGPMDAKITDAAERAELFNGHFANMKRLAAEKKLVLAGPFSEDKDKRGLLIFNVESLEDAQVLVQTDPAVAAGIFTPELVKYYGSAALMQINDVHGKLQKTQF